MAYETEFTAFQADLYLPEGLTADNFALSQRAAGHTLTIKSYADGRIRITGYSASNENFTGNTGEILAFSLTAASNLAEASEIKLKNIFCSTESAKEFVLPNSSAWVLTSDQIPVSSIEFNLDSVTLGVGETYSIKYSVFPEYASNKDVEWNSSNPEVAAVSDDGLVVAIKEGTLTITATAADGSGVSSSCEVTVQKSTVDVASIALDDISISISNGHIEIKGLSSGAIVQLMDISGRVIAREIAVDSLMSQSVNGEKIVILSVGEQSWKFVVD